MRATKALVALTVGMGVLIIVGTTILVAVVVHRLAHPRTPATAFPGTGPGRVLPERETLGEPPGSRIVALERQDDRVLVVAVTGGGRPDRLVVWDVAAGRVLGKVTVGNGPEPAP